MATPPTLAPASAPPFASSPTLRLRWSALSDKGPHRANNEDAFLGVRFDGHETHYLGKIGESTLAAADFVFAVSDGLGGARAGEFASRVAINHITRLLPKGYRLTAQGLSSGFPDLLGELFGNSHHELLRLGFAYEECHGMGATLSLCWFTPEWMYFGHLGDSRIYYLPRDGHLTQITHDHSYVGWLRRQGQINEREARTHPRRHALQQALGAGHQFIEPHIGAVGYRAGDRFLICSDGLTDGLWDHHLAEILRAPAAPTPEPASAPATAQGAATVPCDAAGNTPVPSPTPAAITSPTLAQRLVAQALENSGRDNTTAVVIEILAPEAT